MKKWMKIGFAVYSLGVVVSVFCFGVDYFSFRPWTQAKPFPVPAEPYVIRPKPETSLGQPTFVFRNSLERTGTDTSHALPVDLKETWYYPNLNVGIHGASKASPAIDQTGIYVGSDSGWFYAFDHQGKVKWRYYATDASLGIHSTAALDEGQAYVGTYSGDLIAFDKETGQVSWINKLGETIGSSPVLVDGSIYVTIETNAVRDGYVVRVDRATGRVVWRSEYMGEQSHASPTIDRQNGLVMAGGNNDMYYAFRISDGSTAWKRKADGKIKGTMTLVDGTIHFSTWGGTLYAVDAKTGEEKWKSQVFDRSQSSATYVPGQDLLVVSSASGHIYGFDRKTGKEKWRKETGTPLSRFPSALAVRRKQEGRLPAKSSSAWIIWTSCRERELCAIDPLSGRVEKSIPLKGVLSGMPVAFGDSLFVAENEGGLLKLSAR